MDASGRRAVVECCRPYYFEGGCTAAAGVMGYEIAFRITLLSIILEDREQLVRMPVPLVPGTGLGANIVKERVLVGSSQQRFSP